MLSEEGDGELLSWEAMQKLLVDINNKVDWLLAGLDYDEALGLSGLCPSSQAQGVCSGCELGLGTGFYFGGKAEDAEARLLKVNGFGFGFSFGFGSGPKWVWKVKGHVLSDISDQVISSQMKPIPNISASVLAQKVVPVADDHSIELV